MEALRKFRAYEGETEGSLKRLNILILAPNIENQLAKGKRKEHKDTWKQGDAISFWNTPACRRAEVPSAGGLASARYTTSL